VPRWTPRPSWPTPLHHQLLALTHTEDFREESPFVAQVLDTTGLEREEMDQLRGSR